MELIWKKLKRGGIWSITFSFVCLFFAISCLLCLLNHNLPDLSLESSSLRGSRMFNPAKMEEVQLGKLGEMMIGMLPDDLPFTVFVPSEEAFERVLRLRVNDSLVEDKASDTFAIVSRLLGFSAVPQLLPSVAVPIRKEISFDSVSGYRLYAWKYSDGTLVVNNIQSEQIDIRKGEIIIHIMGGVIMDTEFEQSFHPDYE